MCILDNSHLSLVSVVIVGRRLATVAVGTQIIAVKSVRYSTGQNTGLSMITILAATHHNSSSRPLVPPELLALMLATVLAVLSTL